MFFCWLFFSINIFSKKNFFFLKVWTFHYTFHLVSNVDHLIMKSYHVSNLANIKRFWDIWYSSILYKTSSSNWLCLSYHLFQWTLFVSKILLQFLYYLVKEPRFMWFTEFFTFYSVMIVSDLLLNPTSWEMFISNSINLNFRETFKNLQSIKNTLQIDKLLQRSIAYQMKDCQFPVAARSGLFQERLLMNMMIRFMKYYPPSHWLNSRVSTIYTIH